MARWLAERMDGFVNPMMVKEVYQGFRGRGFVIGAALALLVSLVGYISVVMIRDDADPGDELLIVLGFCLTFVSVIIIPAGAGSQLRAEISSKTHELIVVTGISPWAIVSGRFQGAALRILLLFAMMGPFMVAAVLLGGVGASIVGLLLGSALAISLLVCSLTLVVNALPALGRASLLVSRAQIVIPIVVFWIGSAVIANLPSSPSPDWLILIWSAALCTMMTVFSLRLAADLLTPEGIRTYAGSKSLMVLVLVCLSVAPYLAKSGPDPDELLPLAAALLLFFSIWWSASDLDPRSPGRCRVFFLVRDGYRYTVLYTAILLAGITMHGAIFDGDAIDKGAIFGAHFVLATGLAKLLARLFDRHGRRLLTYHFILIGLIIVNVMATFPYVIAIDTARLDPSPWISAFLPITFVDPGQFNVRAVHLMVPLAVGAVAGWIGSRPRSNHRG